MMFQSNADRQNRAAKVRKNPVDHWTYTTCGYCSTGCGIEVGVRDGRAVTVRGTHNHPVNQGKLCLKGTWEFEAINAPNRGTHPLMRDQRSHPYQRVSWDAALTRTAAEFRRIMDTYGRDALAVVSTGQIYTEEFYALGKLVRGGIGTNNYDGNTTLCMSSAVSGYKRSFGTDGPPGCYEDFEHTDCLLAFGSNLVECHPVIYYRLKTSLERRRFPVIVIDPRATVFAQTADIHLPIYPGTDLVLLNAIAHVILEERLADREYIEHATTGFQTFKDTVMQYSPEYAEPITGIPAPVIRKVARLYGKAKTAMSIWTMGINQSIHGSDGVVAINNLSLLTGNIGKRGGTSLSITGQCNAMGTREFSSCSGLPGYRLLENQRHREDIARYWGIEASFLPTRRGNFMTDIFPAIEAGAVKGLWLIATNPATALPQTHRIMKNLSSLEFLIVQDVFENVDSAAFAHVFLPAAMWAEKTGTFTNSERRVGLVKKAVDPPGNAKSDLDIFAALADKLGVGHLLPSPTPEAMFDEVKAVSAGRPCDYSGLSYDVLERHGGVQWPAPTEEGSPRLYTDGRFNTDTGKARFIALEFHDTNERPDAEYPFWLNTGRVIEHWHTRTKTGQIANLNKFSPVPYVEMNPADADRIGMNTMDSARVTSKRGAMTARVHVTECVAPGMVFIPFHFAKGANLMTLGLLDPHSRQPAYKQAAVNVEKASGA